MYSRLWAPFILFAVGVCAPAQAGVCMPDGTAPPPAAAHATPDLGAADLSWLLASEAPATAFIDPAPTVALSGQDGAAFRIPAPPSSLLLSVGAVLGLGLLRAGRALRDGALSVAPEWYHTGGPQQIGYATPIDPTLSFSHALVAAPAAVVPSVAPHRYADFLDLCIVLPRAASRPSAPRGPPVL